MKPSEANVILKVIAKGDTIIDIKDLLLALIQKQKEYIKKIGYEIDGLGPFSYTGEKLHKEMKVLDKQISKHIE